MAAPAAELATMYVSIVPSFAGGAKALDSQMGPALKAAGTKAGKTFGESFSKQEISAAQVKKFSSDVEAASAKVTAARQKEEDASGALRVAEAKLSEVRASGKATTSQVIAAEERVAAAARKVAAAQSAAKGPATALASAQKNLESATAEAGKSSDSAAADYAKGWAGLKARMGNFIKGSVASGVDGAEKEAKAGGKRAGDSYVGAFKVGMAALATAGGIGSVMGLADEVLSAGKSNDKIAAALGLNPAEAQKAGSVAGHLFADAYGDSMDDASGAVEAVMSSVRGMRSASNADLESMTAKVLDLSSAFEIDTGRAAQVAGQLITSGLAKDGVEAADLLAGSLQRVPKNVREDILDAVDEYGPFMKSLGITGSDAMGMLVNSSAKGMYGIDKTGDALKEFGIRATDMSKTTSGAYDALGLDQESMTAKLLAGGDTAKDAFAQIVNGLSSMSDPVSQSQAALALFGTPLEDLSVSEIPGFLNAIDPMGDAFDSMKGKAGELGQTLSDNAGTKIESWKRSAQVAFIDILGGKVLPILENVGGWLGRTFGPILDEINGGITAFGAAWVANDGDITSSGFPGFMEGLAYQLHQAFDYVTGTVIPKLQELAKFLWDNRAAILIITAAVAGYVGTIKTLAIISTVRGWITAASAAQWGLNAAMTANPIGIVVAAIAALVAGLIWFFTQTDLGKEIVANAWAWIQGAVRNVVDWFQNTALPIIQDVIRNVGAVFQWIYTNIVLPVWSGIQAAVSAVVTWFTTVLLPGVQAVFAAVGAVFSWLYTSIIAPVFGSIGTILGGFFALYQWIFSAVVAVIQKIVVPAIQWFWKSVIVPVFAAIGKVVSDWWNVVVMPVLNTVIGFFTKTVPAAANWLYTYGIKPVFDAIGKAVSTWWTFVVKPVLDTVIGFFRDTLPAAANWLYTYGIKPVFDSIGGAIKSVWEKIIKPVFDTLSNFMTKSVPKAFEDGVGFIKTAWEKLIEVAKSPVRFVVNTIINDGLIKGLNGIGSFLGLKELPRVALPAGFREGGYTGNIAKDKVAGVVHGDEQVIKSPSRRKFEAQNPGALDYLNRTGELPAYLGAPMAGSLPFIQGALQSAIASTRRLNLVPLGGFPMSIAQTAAQAWNGRSGVSLGAQRWNGSLPPNAVSMSYGQLPGYAIGYYSGQAIQLEPGNSLARETAVHEVGHALGIHHNTGNFSIMHPMLRGAGAVWPTAYDTANLRTLYGAPGAGARPVADPGKGGGWDPIGDIVNGLLDKFKSLFADAGFLADLAIGLGKKLIDSAVSFVSGGGSQSAGGAAALSPTVFDGGGWLENTGGRNLLVQHNKPKPDAVLTNEELHMFKDAARNNVGGETTEVNFLGPVYGNPQHIVDEMEARKRRAATRNNLRSITVGA